MLDKILGQKMFDPKKIWFNKHLGKQICLKKNWSLFTCPGVNLILTLSRRHFSMSVGCYKVQTHGVLWSNLQDLNLS